MELAQQTVPDLILLDVKMPRLDGIEACRQIKALPALQHIPVVFVSALGQEQEIARGQEAGATDYLLKPFIPEDLIKKIHTLLADRR